MPELLEQMYCSQQIVIPPKFPYILKKYCKAAIKTQPYDLLRWSFEYFKALAEHRLPPVKLRLEYPIYSSEGGLTRGCHKVLANQLTAMTDIPMPVLKRAWQGFCLDPIELRRILCVCEVYNRADSVPFLHFIAVAAGLLTKCLTHTMILLCESLTKEPDGGSAAIPLKDFLKMYRFLAAIDASADVKYYNGYREGHLPEEVEEEEVEAESAPSTVATKNIEKDDSVREEEDEYWSVASELVNLPVVNDKIDFSAILSTKAAQPLIGDIARTPSIERANQIERDTYMADRKGKARRSEDVEKHLKQLSGLQMEEQDMEEKVEDVEAKKDESELEEDKNKILIVVYDEDGNEIPYEIYGEEELAEEMSTTTQGTLSTTQGAFSTTQGTVSTTQGAVSTTQGAVSTTQGAVSTTQGAVSTTQGAVSTIKGVESKGQGTKSIIKEDTVSKLQGRTVSIAQSSQKLFGPFHPSEMVEQEEEYLGPIDRIAAKAARAKENRILDLKETFEELAAIVEKFNSANYDLGMIAGRQMSTTSGEFIVQSIEKEIMAYIDCQIAILPDPDLKKKKAKPEEVEMVRGILETFIDENMAIIVPEVEEVEEEEQPIPEIIVVYAIPGIGPTVDSEIVIELEHYAREACRENEVIMPRNLRHYLCPPLENFIEYNYATKREEAQAPVGGGIAD